MRGNSPFRDQPISGWAIAAELPPDALIEHLVFSRYGRSQQKFNKASEITQIDPAVQR